MVSRVTGFGTDNLTYGVGLVQTCKGVACIYQSLEIKRA